jgi:hypothetical protein
VNKIQKIVAVCIALAVLIPIGFWINQSNFIATCQLGRTLSVIEKIERTITGTVKITYLRFQDKECTRVKTRIKSNLDLVAQIRVGDTVELHYCIQKPNYHNLVVNGKYLIKGTGWPANPSADGRLSEDKTF